MLQNTDFTVGLICALPIETTAVMAMLDETYPDLPQRPYDTNSYAYGRIGKHNVVLACLPAGSTGTISAAVVAEPLRQSFPAIRMGLMIGVGGGVPSSRNDIRLGDVVISQPTGKSGGIVQYDYGKSIQGQKFQRTEQLNRPSGVLLGAIARLQAQHGLRDSQMQAYMRTALENSTKLREQIQDTEPRNDQLFEADHKHVDEGNDCSRCDLGRLVPKRKIRRSSMPVIHYGTIASGNQVMRDGLLRDTLAKDLGVLCFEREAAGLMNSFPCLVIKGVSNYADSHKNKDWQSYAALAAAAYGKELLYSTPSQAVDGTAEASSHAGMSHIIILFTQLPNLNLCSTLARVPNAPLRVLARQTGTDIMQVLYKRCHNRTAGQRGQVYQTTRTVHQA